MLSKIIPRKHEPEIDTVESAITDEDSDITTPKKKRKLQIIEED